VPVVNREIGGEGVLVDVLVGVAPPRQRALERVGFPVPTPIGAYAVVDTGASISGVDRRILEALELRGEVNVLDIHTPSTEDVPYRCAVYVVSLTLVSVGGSRLFPELYVLATSFTEDEQARVILGREVLGQCRFFYDGPGKAFEFAF